MATVGVALFTWWLVALSNGPAAYESFIKCITSPIGLVFPIGLTFAFFFHLSAGLRHFVMDSGAGFELTANRSWAWATVAVAVLLTALLWLIIFARMI